MTEISADQYINTTVTRARATRSADEGIVVDIGTYRFPIGRRALDSVLNQMAHGGDVRVVDATCGVVGAVDRRENAVLVTVPGIGAFYAPIKKIRRLIRGETGPVTLWRAADDNGGRSA